MEILIIVGVIIIIFVVLPKIKKKMGKAEKNSRLIRETIPEETVLPPSSYAHLID
jgi:hypothetical protein